LPHAVEQELTERKLLAKNIWNFEPTGRLSDDLVVETRTKGDDRLSAISIGVSRGDTSPSFSYGPDRRCRPAEPAPRLVNIRVGRNLWVPERFIVRLFSEVSSTT
jgi:hypothetical protein